MTPDQKQQLIQKVGAVAAELPQTHLRVVDQCASLQSLQDLVATIDDFSIFDNTRQVIPPGGSVEFGRNNLSRWLGARAAEADSDTAVNDCLRYVESDHFQAYYIALLCGVQIRQQFSVDDTAYLAPANRIPVARINQAAFESLAVRLPVIAPTGIFIRTLTLPRRHIVSDTPEFFDSSEHDSFIDRLRLCLSLTGPVQAQIIATTTTPADGVPCRGSVGWTIHSFRYRSWQPPIGAEHVVAAKSLFDKLDRLTKKDQDRLLITLKKLNDFDASNDDVQRAIDLRVALESLFLESDQQGEFTYKLALRAGYFLGKTFDERRHIADLMRTAYGHGSCAVHNGRLTRKSSALSAQDGQRISSELREAADIVRRAITKSLDHPHTRFEDLILKGGDSVAKENSPT